MEFLRFLRRESKDFNANFFMVGTFAGILNAALLVILTLAAGEAAKSGPSLKTFLLAMLFLGGFWWSKRYLLDRARIIVEEIIRNIRMRIARKILEANLTSFEEVGGASFFNVVSRHATAISQAAIVVIQNCHSVVLVALAFIFILVISMKAFLIVAGTLGVLIALFLMNYSKVMGLMRDVAAQENAFIGGFNDLTHGFKELKMNSARDWTFFHEHYRRLTERSMEMRKQMGLELNKNLLIAHVAFFILLAAVVFVLPKMGQNESQNVVAVLTIVIYIFGPISEVIGAVPFLAEAAGSINEITRIETMLGAMTSDTTVLDAKQAPSGKSPFANFSTIRCRDLEFQYPDTESDRTFKLGPVDFEVRRGEIVFIIGGNGSGKSSFFKVLCGLYAPDSGTITVDDKEVTDRSREDYRNLIAPIFSDFHLFDELLGMEEPSSERAEELLRMMEISGKTRIDGRHLTDIKLSAGQRKRLALLTAIQEDRPLMLFDEWAAEQDPQFRKKFYREIIPALKARGKTIVIITHDDRYFDAADRILKMEYGKFVDYDGEHLRP